MNGGRQRQAQRQRGVLLAPARRPVAARQCVRCARRLRTSRPSGAGRCRGADAGGRPPPALRQPRRGGGRVPAPGGAGSAQGASSRPIAAAPCWGRAVANDDEGDAALAAYQEAQREVMALLEAAPERAAYSATCRSPATASATCTWQRGLCGGARELSQGAGDRPGAGRARPGQRVWQRDLSVSHDRVGEILDHKGDREGALVSFRQGLAIAEELAWRRPANWPGSGTSRSATTASATCCRPGADRRGAGELSARLGDRRGAGGARPGACGLAARPGGQLPQDRLARGGRGNPDEARELLEKGRAIIARLAGIAAHQAQWRSDLSKFDATLRGLQ